MAKEKQAGKQSREVKYCGTIPKEVVKDMPPEIRIQYFFWDELLKRQIQLHPGMFPPLVKEIFGKEYPAGTNITILSTEYVVDRPYGGSGRRIESIRSDLMVQIGSRDIYHMECQMKQGGDIAVRMLEYDVNAALVHGLEQVENFQKKHAGNPHPYKYKIKLPKSAILYVDSTERTPDKESCTMVFPDGTEYEYSVPVLKAQAYTPEAMADKGLNILFPFSPVRFRRRFDAILKMKEKSVSSEKILEKMNALKKDLTKFVSDCIIIINREEENGTLEDRTGADIVEYMGRTCDHLFGKEPELIREVHEVMEPVIKLAREEAEDTIKLIREKAEDTIKLIREEAEDTVKQMEGTVKQMERQLTQKDAEIELIREENENQQSELDYKNEQIIKFVQNYILQCKKEGKTKAQAQQELQSNFSFTLSDAQMETEKWW